MIRSEEIPANQRTWLKISYYVISTYPDIGLKMLVGFSEQGHPIRCELFRTSQNLSITFPALAD